MPFLKSETRAFVAEQIDAFVAILVSFFQRQTVICLIEGVYYGLGFALVGLPYGFLIGFMLGVLNLVPLMGTVLCLPIALPLAYFGGGSATRVVMVLVVWAIGQLLDGYLITPRIQGNKTGLGYAGVIFSFFFWGTVLGPVLGLLLAIPLSAFCVVLWRALKSKYIRPVV
jgi:predicted PurR-regulated permease PerM